MLGSQSAFIAQSFGHLELLCATAAVLPSTSRKKRADEGVASFVKLRGRRGAVLMHTFVCGIPSD